MRLKRLKKWLLKRFKVKLNFPMERAEIKLKLKLYLSLEGDGEPIYLKPLESGIVDNYSRMEYGSSLSDIKAAIIIQGKHVSVRNFTFIGNNEEPPVSFKVE